jgi:hypothetical protein
VCVCVCVCVCVPGGYQCVQSLKSVWCENKEISQTWNLTFQPFFNFFSEIWLKSEKDFRILAKKLKSVSTRWQGSNWPFRADDKPRSQVLWVWGLCAFYMPCWDCRDHQSRVPRWIFGKYRKCRARQRTRVRIREISRFFREISRILDLYAKISRTVREEREWFVREQKLTKCCELVLGWLCVRKPCVCGRWGYWGLPWYMPVYTGVFVTRNHMLIIFSSRVLYASFA